MEFQPEVIIVGAGAAGLAAAMRLTRAGVNAHLLEARDRIGGRIHTLHESGLAIELGAEFVHGKSRELWDLIGGSTEQVEEISGTPWCIRDGQVGPCDFFDQVYAFLQRMEITSRDQSFAAWAHSQTDVPDAIKRRAFAYVVGFNAAHAEKISVNSLVRQSEAEDKIGGDRSFRIRSGYTFVPRTLLGMCDPDHLRVSMNTAVDSIEWRAGKVTVRSQDKVFDAPKALVTLPLGVLQANVVQFYPALDSKRPALERLAVGHVIRVTMEFKERFWDALAINGRTLEDMGFLFTESKSFPTFWTNMPWRTPLLVAWAPATAAESLSGKGEEFQVAEAVRSLAEQLDIPSERLHSLLQHGWVHDWQTDPFARGAYTYICVGGDDAVRMLSENLDDTLFFAGEATDLTANIGTVHGAIASGYRAANEIMSRG